MTAHAIDDRIRKVLRTMPDLAVDSDFLTEQDDLYDAGLKSLTALQLMLALEDEFGIEVPESMLHQGLFSSLAVIRQTVNLLIGAQEASSVGGSWATQA